MAGLSSMQRQVVEQMQPLLKTAPWIMRVTERKEFTGPVLEICERIPVEAVRETNDPQTMLFEKKINSRTKLKDWGRLYNGNLRACLPAVRSMMMGMTDKQGHPLDIHLLLNGQIVYRGQIPLDETIGGKLSLLFRLHARVRDRNRAELMAWRIARFTREETLYWLTKVSISAYGKRSVEWAKSGLRLMLAGQQKDKEEIQWLLKQLRK